MGGTRCYFRDCPVSTSLHPGMHFFHFPVKDRERYLKWLEMADVKHFLDMPILFQKNRNVCARHFRDECFMNYKKNRLVSGKKAVPTLMRLSGDVALDYANLGPDGLPKLITLPKPTDPHLIPPPDFQCPLGFDNNSMVLFNDNVVVTEAKATSDQTFSRKRRAPNTESKLLNKVKILNVAAPEIKQMAAASAGDTSACESEVQYVVQLNEQPALDEKAEEDIGIYEIQQSDGGHDDGSPTGLEVMQLSASSDPTTTEVSVAAQQEELISKEQHDTVCQQLKKLLEAERNAHAAEKLALTTRLQRVTDSLWKSEIELERAQQQAETLSAEHANCMAEQQALSQKHAELQCQNAELYEECAGMASKLQQLQEAHDRLQQKCATLTEQQQKQHQQHQQVATVSTSKETALTAAEATCPTPSNHVAVLPPSKAQLFNGIKKYLSASMTALVRMEMFGQEERAWKPDERRAAMDLLRLGENVYRYVSDEWRCRLPALRQVRTWLNEDVVGADDEEDL